MKSRKFISFIFIFSLVVMQITFFSCTNQSDETDKTSVSSATEETETPAKPSNEDNGTPAIPSNEETETPVNPTTEETKTNVEKMFYGFDSILSFSNIVDTNVVPSKIRSLTNDTTLKITGPINAIAIKQIISAMNENDSVLIALDLSDTTGIIEWKDWVAACKTLYSISLPNTVKEVAGGAFVNCKKLKGVTIPYSISSYPYLDGIDINVSGSLDNLIERYLNENVFPKWGVFYVNGMSIRDLTIPNTITSIGEHAFYGCLGLTSITIPNSVTSIGEYAFYGCSGLTSITIPNSVTSIGDSAFCDCRGLTSIIIPNSVTDIMNSAFRGCSELTSVEIPNSVTSIGDSAFSFCSGLTSIIIPNSVTSIGYFAFSYCDSLTKVNYRGSENEWSRISISSGNNCLSNATIIYNYTGE